MKIDIELLLVRLGIRPDQCYLRVHYSVALDTHVINLADVHGRAMKTLATEDDHVKAMIMADTLTALYGFRRSIRDSLNGHYAPIV